MRGTDSRRLRGRWTGLAPSFSLFGNLMDNLDTHTLGAKPKMSEVRAYYLREDILGEISRLTYLRDVELIYRTVEDNEFHIELGPQTGEALQRVFGGLFDSGVELDGGYYPWLHCWSNRAYEIDPRTGQRRLIGFDSGRELDFDWRRSFAELYQGMAVLDELGIYYRVKFSGHRSLHLCIPAEAVPEQYRHENGGDWSRWHYIVNTIGTFVHDAGCGDALWTRMAGEEPFSGVYSLHRQCGLVGVPLVPDECAQFRPWMATVHLAAPMPSWWDVPEDAQEKFARALSRVQDESVVFDMGAVEPLDAQGGTSSGYVVGAVSRAKRVAETDRQGQSDVVLHAEEIGARRRAVWCAMVLGASLPQDVLRLALDDDDVDVRWFALEGIYRSGVTDVLDTALLCKVQELVDKRQRFVREAAIDVLLHHQEVGFALLLEVVGRKRQWKKDGTGPSRRRREFHEIWDLQQYVQVGGETATKQLVGLAGQGSIEIARGVCAVLERGGEVGIAGLISLLTSKSQDARREAMVSLMYHGEMALPLLERTVSEIDGEMRDFVRRIVGAVERLQKGEGLCWTMRPSTLAMIVELGTESAVKVLSQNLHSGNRRERYHAMRGLVYLGRASMTVLIDALGSPEPLVRRRASEALRELAAPESFGALRTALEDTDVGVRVNAVRALGRMDHSQARESLVSCAEDRSRAVRRAVREVLSNKRLPELE